jgi:phosphatidylglycerophosphate synthase
MLDGLARRQLDGLLQALARRLGALGVTADGLTLIGLVLAVATAVCIAQDLMGWALFLLGLNRLADGLDGPVARLTKPTDRGGILDIVCDFAFYGMVPLAFAIRDPSVALPAAALLLAFYINGASFLSFAIMAAKRGLNTEAQGPKSLYYTSGLVEGTETIAFFVAMILFPHWFSTLALSFAALCLLTTIARLILAWRIFPVDREDF